MTVDTRVLQDGRWNILLFLAGRAGQWSWRTDVMRATGLDAWSYWYCTGRLHRDGLTEFRTGTGPGYVMSLDRRHVRLSPRALATIGKPPSNTRMAQLMSQPMFLETACLALAADIRQVLAGHGRHCRCIAARCPARWLDAMTTQSRAVARPLLAGHLRHMLWHENEPARVWPVLLALAVLLGVPAGHAAEQASAYVTGVLGLITEG